MAKKKGNVKQVSAGTCIEVELNKDLLAEMDFLIDAGWFHDRSELARDALSQFKPIINSIS
jgi:metal-responsive CopG/Arc/MetJ family transcriptional regulator